MTSIASPTEIYILVDLVTIFGIGGTAGYLLIRKQLDNTTLLLLVALVGSVAVDLILCNQLISWAIGLESMGPISVSSTPFLNGLYASIFIGILGAILMSGYILKRG